MNIRTKRFLFWISIVLVPVIIFLIIFFSPKQPSIDPSQLDFILISSNNWTGERTITLSNVENMNVSVLKENFDFPGLIDIKLHPKEQGMQKITIKADGSNPEIIGIGNYSGQLSIYHNNRTLFSSANVHLSLFKERPSSEAISFSPELIEIALDNHTNFYSKRLGIGFLEKASVVNITLVGSNDFKSIVKIDGITHQLNKTWYPNQNLDLYVSTLPGLGQSNTKPGIYEGNLKIIYKDSRTAMEETVFVPINVVIKSPLTTDTSMMVDSPNDTRPIAVNDIMTTMEDIPILIPALANDIKVDIDDQLSIVSVSDLRNDNAQVNSNGTITYIPPPNFNGTESFSYTIRNSHGRNSTAIVKVHVKPVNDAPVVQDDVAVTTEGSYLITVDLTANDTDVDGDLLVISSIDPKSAYGGSVMDNGNGIATYVPNADFSGIDSFNYVLSDNYGGTDTGMVTIRVIESNYAPIANSGSFLAFEDTTKELTLNATDDDDSLRYTIVDGPRRGFLTGGSGASRIYSPFKDYQGTDSFTFRVNDGQANSTVAEVKINIVDNTIPTAHSKTLSTIRNLEKSITLTGTDVDGDSLTFSIVEGPSHGAISGTGSTKTYIPTHGYVGSDSFKYTVKDEGGNTSTPALVSITINSPINIEVLADTELTTGKRDASKDHNSNC